MKKKALVLTYHVKNSTRVGGFHYFIKFLIDAGYDTDWVTIPVSSTWLFGRNDRENASNFISLVKGFTYNENNCIVKCFTVPLWIPAKMAKKIGLNSGNSFWPVWHKLRRKLSNHYDVVLFEGVACQYAKEISNDYKDATIIYRPSDILATFSSVINPEKMEIDAIRYSTLTACVDETEVDYYKRIGADEEKLVILRNPLSLNTDILSLKNYSLDKHNDSVIAVYMGVSFCDHDFIEYAASRNKECMFYVIGPFNRKTHDNVIYTGPMTKEQYEAILSKSNVAIAPTVLTEYKIINHIKYGFTGKIIAYMKYLLPIVATCSSNYLNIDGFFCVDTKDEFSAKISECLKYSMEDREKLREGYLKTMKIFSEEESRKQFLKLVHGEDDNQ